MKVVIDINEETYTRIKTALIINAGNLFYDEILTSVAEGTPLPKGHGDLIDRNMVYAEFNNTDLSSKEMIGKLLIFGIPTIIPEDK